MKVLYEKVVEGKVAQLVLKGKDVLQILFDGSVIDNCKGVAWAAIKGEKWVYEFLVDCALEEGNYVIDPEIEELKKLFL